MLPSHKHVHSKNYEHPVDGVNIMATGEYSEFHLAKYRAKIARHPSDCGFDLYGLRVIKCERIGRGSYFLALIDTGIHLVFPHGVKGELVSRSSSLEALHGARIEPGQIDAGFSGNLIVRVTSLLLDMADVSSALLTCIENQTAIAQVIPVVTPTPFRVVQWDQEVIDQMGRGQNGFGSTNATSCPPQPVR